jgi:hypothetical protein
MDVWRNELKIDVFFEEVFLEEGRYNSYARQNKTYKYPSTATLVPTLRKQPPNTNHGETTSKTQ